MLQEKRKADVVDLREGTTIQSMAEFLLQHFMFKFGTKELVQLRLAKCVTRDRVGWCQAWCSAASHDLGP